MARKSYHNYIRARKVKIFSFTVEIPLPTTPVTWLCFFISSKKLRLMSQVGIIRFSELKEKFFHDNNIFILHEQGLCNRLYVLHNDKFN